MFDDEDDRAAAPLRDTWQRFACDLNATRAHGPQASMCKKYYTCVFIVWKPLKNLQTLWLCWCVPLYFLTPNNLQGPFFCPRARPAGGGGVCIGSAASDGDWESSMSGLECMTGWRQGGFQPLGLLMVEQRVSFLHALHLQCTSSSLHLFICSFQV